MTQFISENTKWLETKKILFIGYHKDIIYFKAHGFYINCYMYACVITMGVYKLGIFVFRNYQNKLWVCIGNL